MSGIEGGGDAYDLELAAASMLADGKDVHVLLKVLAGQLAGALGDRLRVDRKGGLLRKSSDITALEASIGSEQFRAAVSGPGVTCTIGHSSGGIRIRSDTVSMDEWLRRLLEALKVEASHSQTARLALESIVIGGPE